MNKVTNTNDSGTFVDQEGNVVTFDYSAPYPEQNKNTEINNKVNTIAKVIAQADEFFVDHNGVSWATTKGLVIRRLNDSKSTIIIDHSKYDLEHKSFVSFQKGNEGYDKISNAFNKRCRKYQNKNIDIILKQIKIKEAGEEIEKMKKEK